METSERVFHWLPRVICIIAILFISMFAIDSFAPGYTIWQQLGAFFIHLIPTFILTALLIVAWKWEYIGGIIFMIIGLGFSPSIFIHNYYRTNSVSIGISNMIMITFPFILVGILFVVSHFLKKKNLKATHNDLNSLAQP